MIAPVSYCPAVFPSPENVFAALEAQLDWTRHPGTPRSEYYYARDGLPYAYKAHGGMREYHSQPSNALVEAIWIRSEAYTRTRFDAVFLNYYGDGRDHLGWHADDSPEMDDERCIAIASFGAAREIWFRDNADRLTQRQRLESGSLCVMSAGMQDTHQHRIPKSDLHNCGPRISLTFRGVVR